MIKARNRTKNNMQNILNSKNNITKWGYFWIGQDVVLDWNKFERDFPWSGQTL